MHVYCSLMSKHQNHFSCEGEMTATRRTAFGKAVRKLRQARGTSLRRFAEEVSLSPTYLSMVERDKVPPPTERRMVAIAEALETDPDELLALGGRVPSDLADIILQRPKQFAELLRSLDEFREEGNYAAAMILEQFLRLLELSRAPSGGGSAPNRILSMVQCMWSDTAEEEIAVWFEAAARAARCSSRNHTSGDGPDEATNGPPSKTGS